MHHLLKILLLIILLVSCSTKKADLDSDAEIIPEELEEENTYNDGSYSWTIPESYDEGTDYKVRISYVSDATVYDESDANFTLQSPAPTGNYSLSFDGDDDYVIIPASSLNGLSAFSFSAWFYSDGDQTGWSNIIQQDDTGEGNDSFYIRYQN